MTIPNRILILQLRRVGDVIFTLPVIGALRKKFPGATIDFLVEKPSDQMVRLHPGLNDTLIYEKDRPLFWIREIRRRKYDWVLDFHSNGRTLMIALFSGAPLRAGMKGPFTRKLVYSHLASTSDKKYITEQKLDVLSLLGVETQPWGWDIKPPQEEMQWAEQFLKSAGAEPSGEGIVGIAPASRRATRAWKEDRFAQIAERAIAQGNRVLALWGPGEMDLIEKVVSSVPEPLRGKIIIPPQTSLVRLAALIKQCSAVLAVDNGPKNMAVALGVPTVTISGPTNPLSFDLQNHPSHLVAREDKLPCISCGRNVCPFAHECMENLSTDAVWQKLHLLLTQNHSNKRAVAV